MMAWILNLGMGTIDVTVPIVIRRGPTVSDTVLRRGPSAAGSTVRRGPSQTSDVIRRG